MLMSLGPEEPERPPRRRRTEHKPDAKKMRDAAGLLVMRYDALDKEAKESVHAQFPHIAKTIEGKPYRQYHYRR